MYCSPLTKKELIDAGIIDVYRELGEWHIVRLWRKCGTADNRIRKEISITLATRKHKYRPNKEYYKVSFSTPYKTYNIPLSRLIYVWFVKDISEPGMVVDHIDNDSFNNDPANLRLLTIEENLTKRFEDNPEAWTNQWGRPKGYSKE